MLFVLWLFLIIDSFFITRSCYFPSTVLLCTFIHYLLVLYYKFLASLGSSPTFFSQGFVLHFHRQQKLFNDFALGGKMTVNIFVLSKACWSHSVFWGEELLLLTIILLNICDKFIVFI